jgi:hypothetical protein
VPPSESRGMNKVLPRQCNKAQVSCAGYKSQEAYPPGNHNRVSAR